MMNLLIGIISEKLADVLENREVNNYAQLCEILLFMESLMLWKRKDQGTYQHLVYVEYANT